MKRATESQASLVGVLAALAEPLRLRMLRVLEREELLVGEVSKVVQLPQSTVSRHLKMLAEQGLVVKRAAGTATLYRLVPDDMPPSVRAVWSTVQSQLGRGAEGREDERRLASVLAERRLDSQAFFGRIAGEWDAVRANLFGCGFTSVALLGLISRDWEVADIGCGTGNAAELLAPHVRRVIAVDVSAPMLEAARHRLEGRRNVDFRVGSAESVPIEGGSVDAVVCALLLHHVDEPTRVVAESARVLRRERGGGVLLVIDMLSHDRAEYRRLMGHKHLGFAPDEVRRLYASCGFEDVRVETLPTEPESRGPGLFVATGRVGAGSARAKGESR